MSELPTPIEARASADGVDGIPVDDAGLVRDALASQLYAGGIPDTMPFVGVRRELGNAELVYELGDERRSIVRVLTSLHKETPYTDEERATEIDRCQRYAHDLTDELQELRDGYGIVTPGVRFAIGALQNDPNLIGLYAHVDRVEGEMLEDALENGSVPDEQYDQFLLGQIRYAMDRIMAGTTIRPDILGEHNEKQYMYGPPVPGDDSPQIILVDIGTPPVPVPSPDAISRSSRRRTDGSRPEAKSSLGTTISLHVYTIDSLLAKRTRQGYSLSQTEQALTAARSALLERWPAIIGPLEQKRLSAV